jgi:hypothetical protein
MNRPRKRRYYSGELAKPIEIAMCGSLAGDANPKMGQSIKPTIVKLELLCDHFGIDRSQPGRWRDLSMNLAHRHEPGYFATGRIQVTALFLKYGVDPNDPVADFLLALNLARQHVPGFALKPLSKPRMRIETLDLVRLALAATGVMQHLSTSGKRDSVREVAAALRDPKLLDRMVTVQRATPVSSLIKRLGNRHRGHPRPWSDRSLRGHLSEMKNAWRAYANGTATPFQIQFIEEAMPIIIKLAEGDIQVGQN